MPLPLLLGGLATGLLGMALPAAAEVKRRMLDGKYPLVEHIDENDSHCGNRGQFEGCWAKTATGDHHVWYSSAAPQWVIEHELAHVRGMEHSPWVQEKGFWGDIRNCSFVTTEGGGYDLGTKICNTPRGETRESINALFKALTE